MVKGGGMIKYYEEEAARLRAAFLQQKLDNAVKEGKVLEEQARVERIRQVALKKLYKLEDNDE